MSNVAVWERSSFSGLEYWSIVGYMPLNMARDIHGAPGENLIFAVKGSQADLECSDSMDRAHAAIKLSTRWEIDDLLGRARRESDRPQALQDAARRNADRIRESSGI